MDCKTIHKKLIFFIDGDLLLAETEEIKTHLSECGDCAAFAGEMKKTFDVLASEKSAEVNPFFYTRIKARLENQVNTGKEKVLRPAFVKVLQPVFFTLLLLAGVYTGIKLGTPVATKVNPAIYAGQEIIPYLNEMETETIEGFLME